MGLLVRLLLAFSGAAAAFLVGRDADNFGVVQGMLALLVAVAVLALAGLAGRRRSVRARAGGEVGQGAPGPGRAASRAGGRR